MEEIKVKEILSHERTSIGKVATLLLGADKANAYGMGIRLFRDEKDGYLILINDIVISCDTEEQVISAVHQILLNIENSHQQGRIPLVTLRSNSKEQEEQNFSFLYSSENEKKISLDIIDENSRIKPQAYRAKLEDLLISGKPLEETEIVAERLIKQATVYTEYQGENVEAVDLNIERKA